LRFGRTSLRIWHRQHYQLAGCRLRAEQLAERATCLSSFAVEISAPIALIRVDPWTRKAPTIDKHEECEARQFAALQCVPTKPNQEEDMLPQIISIGALLTVLSFGLASAEEMDAQMQCDALSDAFNNYSAKQTDPDMDAATALSKEGVDDCRNKKTDEGINKITNSMAMVHDGKASGRSGRK
jgi:hypothetical protein